MFRLALTVDESMPYKGTLSFLIDGRGFAMVGEQAGAFF